MLRAALLSVFVLSSDIGSGIESVEVKRFAKFHELPITAIEPAGWIKTYLENQRDGLTGHLDTLGWPFDQDCWAGKDPGKGPHNNDLFLWAAYELSGLWLDGMIRCGHLLRDDALIKKAREQIEYTVTHTDADGRMGPQKIENLWPRAVFFRALMAEYSASRDKRIPEALHKHYLDATAADRHSGGWRNICNVEEICWLYGLTGDRQLLDYALGAYNLFCAKNGHLAPDALLSDVPTAYHGVAYMVMMVLPAILYTYTGETRLLEATVNGFRKLDRDHMLIDGIPSSNERFQGKGAIACHENCVCSDYAWSAGYVLQATGGAEWADKIERACFNAGIGSVTKDFRAHQYFSSANQVILTRNSDHNSMGRSRMSFRPIHECECCTGNANRFMPNYACRMWLSDGGGGLVAALYGPSAVRAHVGKDAQEITITEDTKYPFSETIQFAMRTEGKVRFPLWVRVPGWCSGATVTINGQSCDVDTVPGSFVKLEREFSDGDVVVVSLPMSLKLTHWPRGGVGVERGPLVYSLLIEEDWQINEDVPRSSKDFPAWDILPSSPWNYALATDEEHFERDIEVVRNAATSNPWDIKDSPPPITLRVPVRRVKKWTFQGVNENPKDNDEKLPHKEYMLRNPELPEPESLSDRLDEKIERVSLVPYGCTHLRLTIFPRGGTTAQGPSPLRTGSR